MFGKSRELRVLTLAVAVFAVAAGWTAFRETGVVFGSGYTPAEKFAALADGALQPASSEASKRQVLDDCYTVVGSAYGQLQPSERWEQLLSACGSIADGIVAQVPVHAYAWYVGAMVAAERGDTVAFDQKMVTSQKYAPNEVWLAFLRSSLAAGHESALSAAGEAAYSADLALLAQSRSGIASIAERYRTDPGFRERITAVVETLPASVQSNFVTYVKRAIQRART